MAPTPRYGALRRTPEFGEAVQRNQDAGLYDTGRLSLRHENGVWHFQKPVREALAAA